MIRKVLSIVVFSILSVLGFNTYVFGSNIDQKDNNKKLTDSIIVYKAQKDSLQAELISSDLVRLNEEIKGKTDKRMESPYDDEKTPVHPKDLPNSIQSALDGAEFKDWKTASASLVKTYKGNSYYEIALFKEGDTRIAKFKGNGKVL